jgi:hypothetical protein
MTARRQDAAEAGGERRSGRHDRPTKRANAIDHIRSGGATPEGASERGEVAMLGYLLRPGKKHVAVLFRGSSTLTLARAKAGTIS